MLDPNESRFDMGAAAYDERTGLPEAQCERIARSLMVLTQARPGDVLLELGAGTGQLGVHIASLGLSYVGIDSSAAMLAEFERRKAGASGAIELVRADVNGAWPVASAAVIFSSRAAHLFELEHVVSEASRLARAAGTAFVLGRVERDPESLRSVLRREMRERVRRRGLLPNDGNRRQRELLTAFTERGAQRVGPLPSALWTVESSAAKVIGGWRGKPGLAGLELPAEVKASVLSELEAFAKARFGSLEISERAEERYVLDGVLLPAAASA